MRRVAINAEGGAKKLKDRAKKSITSIKSILKKENLPFKGKIRYMPPEDWTPSQMLPRQNGGFLDKFGNVRKKGPSRKRPLGSFFTVRSA